MAVSDQVALVRAMCDDVDEAVTAGEWTGRDRPSYAFDAEQVGQGSEYWLYEFPLPAHATTLGDAPVEVRSGGRRVTGWTAGSEERRATVALSEDLGDRVENARIDVDTLAPLRDLRIRLTELVADGRASLRDDMPFRVDQAAIVLCAPGGRLQDRIARAADSTDTWTLDDRQADVLRSALLYRWAFVQGGPDEQTPALLGRLLDRLLELDASVLLVSPDPTVVDRSLLAVCERLGGRVGIRSGVLQRIGPIGLPELQERYGAVLDPSAIAVDLHAEIDRRAAELDGADLWLQHEEAVLLHANVEQMYGDLAERLQRARSRGRLARLRTGDKPDELVIAMHRVRPQLNAARDLRDRVAAELNALPEEAAPSGASAKIRQSGGTFGERRRQVAEARDELAHIQQRVDAALRQRCRLVATTPGQAFGRRLPRESFDVVVVAGPVAPPEAFYLGGLSTRSVIAVGEPDRRMSPTEPRRGDQPHPLERSRRRSLPRLGRRDRQRADWRP
jgi:hypothetical protein